MAGLPTRSRRDRVQLPLTAARCVAFVLFVSGCPGDEGMDPDGLPPESQSSAARATANQLPGAAGSGASSSAAGRAAVSSAQPLAGAGGHTALPAHGAHGEAGRAPACPMHMSADARDDQLPNEPQTLEIGTSGARDLVLPQGVLDWMAEHQFEAAHDGWHLVRKWDQACRQSHAAVEDCAPAQRLVSQGLWRAEIQQGAPGDGYAFMVMHRHMIQMLRASFPKHAHLFDGFTHVPRSKGDDQNFTPWRNIAWTSDNLKGLEILEHIEQHLAQFPSEDDLGQYIENTYRWTAQQPQQPVNAPGSGLHGALHAQWAVNGSPANLIQQSVDVRNFMFWKLHGWIDDIWERYRRAKGLSPDDPQLQRALEAQCLEMVALQPRNRKGVAPGAGPAAASGSAPLETGVFAEQIRPVLDSTCAGCHGAVGPNAGLSLGGPGISSAEVIAGLVNAKATNREYDLVEPGLPERSWLFLKASGEAASATCSSGCNRESMPPAGLGFSELQLAALAQWIQNGASGH